MYNTGRRILYTNERAVFFVSTREMEMMLEMVGGAIGSFIGPILGTLLSGVILTYCIRWFVFVKAGEKGWKALIPFYSDYVQYKIVWDGRIYLALLIGFIASPVLGAIFGLLHPVLGSIVSIIMGVVVAGANAVAGMILISSMPVPSVRMITSLSVFTS